MLTSTTDGLGRVLTVPLSDSGVDPSLIEALLIWITSLVRSSATSKSAEIGYPTCTLWTTAFSILSEPFAVILPLDSGQIDAAAVSMTPLSDYGIKRVTSYHYVLGTNGAPLALLDESKKLRGVAGEAKDIFRKYSGEWSARHFIDAYEISDRRVLEALKSDPKRSVIFPSPPDLDIAHRAFETVVEESAAKSPHNRELLNLTEAEIARVRSNN